MRVSALRQRLTCACANPLKERMCEPPCAKLVDMWAESKMSLKSVAGRQNVGGREVKAGERGISQGGSMGDGGGGWCWAGDVLKRCVAGGCSTALACPHCDDDVILRNAVSP